MKRCKMLIMCYFIRQAQKNTIYRGFTMFYNISENSEKHFILQGRRVRETDKINKPLMLLKR